MSPPKKTSKPRAQPYALVARNDVFTRVTAVPPSALAVAFVESSGATHVVIEFDPRQTHPRLAVLTPAEREVTALTLAGKSNEEIGARRKTSTRTVANQLAAIYRKVGVSSRTELLIALSP